MRTVLSLLLVALAASVADADATCAGCSVVVGLVGQILGNGTPPAEWPFDVNPDELCTNLTLCDGSCTLWGPAWPVVSPNFPTDGKVDDTAPQDAGNTTTFDVSAIHGAAALQSGSEISASGAVAKLRELAANEGAKRVPALLESAVAWVDTHRNDLEEAGAGLFFGLASAASRSSVKAMLANVMASRTSDVKPLEAGSLPCDDLTNITCDISTLFDDHLTLADGDGDAHAAGDIPLLTTNLRGTSWRGRDCDDTNANVYPGRRTVAAGLSADVDHNCNGISGTDPASGQSYEDLYCSGPNAPMGIVGIGDSALAHFHIPPQYLNAKNFSLDNVLDAAANELDWPQCSWSTGFRNTTDCPESPIAMGSIYQRMRERNLCMHRDYTNFGVNGARVSSAASDLIPNLKRDRQNDAPVLAFYALIGNDVCNGHPGMSRMTTPAEFRVSVMQSFQEFNNSLPQGSHVAVMGLVDGLILYDTMHNQTHPLGIDYTSVYDALTCNGANPCNGWLTSNDTLRQLTQERANNLTSVYDSIIAETQGHWNFDVYRLDLDWVALFQKYVREYGDARGAIEPVDGFHPSQATHQLLAQIVWENIETNKPDWLPPVNPNNAKIQELFGNQGGY